jgi:hypothetical protein
METVYDCAGRRLGQNSGNRADSEGNAHALLVPPSAGEVNRQEWSDAGLDVGQQEVQPIQTAQRGQRRLSRSVCGSGGLLPQRRLFIPAHANCSQGRKRLRVFGVLGRWRSAAPKLYHTQFDVMCRRSHETGADRTAECRITAIQHRDRARSVGRTLTENFSKSDEGFGQNRCCTAVPVVTKVMKFFRSP